MIGKHNVRLPRGWSRVERHGRGSISSRLARCHYLDRVLQPGALQDWGSDGRSTSCCVPTVMYWCCGASSITGLVSVTLCASSKHQAFDVSWIPPGAFGCSISGYVFCISSISSSQPRRLLTVCRLVCPKL